MKSLKQLAEGLFDVDKSVDKIDKIDKLAEKLKKSVRPRNGARIAKNLLEYLDAVGTKSPNKKFNRSGVEIGIYVGNGFTMVNWTDDYMWTIHEFGYLDSGSFEIASEWFDENCNWYAVYEIDKKVQEFLVKIFF